MSQADISGNMLVLREVVRQVMLRPDDADNSDMAATAVEAGFRLLEGLLSDINRIADAMEVIGNQVVRNGFN